MSASRTDYVYGHVIEALSGGLYPNKLDIVREYIQNAYDAISEKIRREREPKIRQELLESSRIDVTIKAGSLFIHDNALGMEHDTLEEYRKIGFSKKTYGEYAGWRGIGKAAGLSITEKLIVTTSPGSGETYQLTFNAKNMMDEVYQLRSRGENIPFNDLVERHSDIKIIQGGDSPFTTVELCKIKSEASELLNKDKLIAHLSILAPVPFNPQFMYGKKIERELEQSLDEYTPVKLYVEGEQIFKPYLHEWIEPGIEEEELKKETVDEPYFIPIYDEKREDLIAFCWYCLHSTTGQIKTPIIVSGTEAIDVSGLIFRVDDIKVGDAYLTRQTLWKTTPERSLWAIGEIHVLDHDVEPSSDRNDFLDNYARLEFFNKAEIIAKEISRKAKKVSDESTAERKINEVDVRLNKISQEVADKSIRKELLGTYMYQVHAIVEEAEKRKPKTPEEELKNKADDVIRSGKEVIIQLERAMKNEEETETIVKDVTKDLNFDEKSILVYESIINILKSYFFNKPGILEDIIKKITAELEQKFSS